jgi:hypothetical protein
MPMADHLSFPIRQVSSGGLTDDGFLVAGQAACKVES